MSDRCACCLQRRAMLGAIELTGAIDRFRRAHTDALKGGEIRALTNACEALERFASDVAEEIIEHDRA